MELEPSLHLVLMIFENDHINYLVKLFTFIHKIPPNCISTHCRHFVNNYQSTTFISNAVTLAAYVYHNIANWRMLLYMCCTLSYLSSVFVWCRLHGVELTLVAMAMCLE